MCCAGSTGATALSRESVHNSAQEFAGKPRVCICMERQRGRGGWVGNNCQLARGGNVSRLRSLSAGRDTNSFLQEFRRLPRLSLSAETAAASWNYTFDRPNFFLPSSNRWQRWNTRFCCSIVLQRSSGIIIFRILLLIIYQTSIV